VILLIIIYLKLCPTHIRELKMKKIVILLAISFCAISLQAQNCDSIAQSIVERIKNYSPDNLLPYYGKESEKWGLMSKDGKILTQPLARFPSDIIFNPNLHLALYEKEGFCSIKIYGSDYSYEVDEKEHDISVMTIDLPIRANPNINGFTTSGNSTYINAYSSRYKDLSNNAFMHNGRLYAMAQLAENNKHGIIDQEGNPLPHFDFKYNSLYIIKKDKNQSQLWFYFEEETGKKGFINIGGKRKLYGKLLSPVYGSTYDCQSNEEKTGVVDLRTLEWVIKPQKNFRMGDIIRIGQKEENSTYYIVVYQGDERFLIDMRKKIYKPIQ